MPPSSGNIGTGDCWDWTLGKEQYDRLYETLRDSDANWKFVFTHMLVSSTEIFPPDPNYKLSCYGKGGIEIAKYKVDGNPTFEWGGEDDKGNYVFDQERPGWSHGPIHDLLVEHNVTILFHGHDHFFAKQDLDGIVYQMIPKPEDSKYSLDKGFKKLGKYKNGVFIENSGHLEITVDPDFIKVDYIRAYLPGDGNNGEISYSYTIK